MLFGDVPGEVPLPPLGELKPDTELKIRNQAPQPCKRAVAVSIGAELGAVPPHPDIKSRLSKVGGVMKRAACKVPTFEKELLAELRQFTRHLVRRDYTPFEESRNINFEEWISHTTYPDWRKQELRECYFFVEKPENIMKEPRFKKVGSFVKNEFYNALEHKWARIINARADASKVVFGPYMHAIEEVVYNTIPVGAEFSPFIKHVPVADRPKHIMSLFEGLVGKIVATDYTSFEALFVKQVMASVEFELYDWMLSRLPEHDLLMKILTNVLLGTNTCDFRDMLVKLEATRMSGEMCTSLGNGFSNRVFMEFACHKYGSKCYGFVEGDDGLFVVIGPVPPAEFFTRLGLIIKLEEHVDVSSASFCGMIFDPEEQVVIADPRKILATTPWLDGKFAQARRSKLVALLRCKALSLASQYPGSPVIAAYADYLLRATRGQSLEWARKALQNDSDARYKGLGTGFDHIEVVREVGMRTRILMENKFGLTVDYQLFLENYFDSLSKLQPLNPDIMCFVMPDLWVRNYSKYVFLRPRQDPTAPLHWFGTRTADHEKMFSLLATVASAESLFNLQQET